MKRQKVGILLFDDVEVLDFAGPFEVFSRARTVPGVESRRSEDSAPFAVFTVAKTSDAVSAVGGLEVTPAHTFETAPRIDILVVPGGFGTRALVKDAGTIDWIRSVARGANRVTSVCTGALLLAEAGLLSGRRATTHWCALDQLRSMRDDIEVDRDSRWVDDGIVTSAGIAAGIDMAFHIVETELGTEVADETARYMDYPRGRQRASGS